MSDLWLVGLLVMVAVTCGSWGMYTVQRGQRHRLKDLVQGPRRGGRSPAPAEPESLLTRLARLLRPLLPGAALQDLRWRLLWAGRPLGWTAEEFMTFRISATLVLVALGPVLAMGTGLEWVITLAMGAVGLWGPDTLVNSRVRQRQRQVQQELPLFLDLLAAAVEAGLGLGEAVRRVAEEVPGLVAAEFTRAQQEMAAGKPRSAAWRDLMDRTPSQELRSVVMSVMQAEQFGTSVSEQLRMQVRQLRIDRQQRAQSIAQATTIKMRVPMMLFILVPFMALVLGPAVIGVAQLLFN